MKLKNPTLIEYFGTDTLTEDMNINSLKIALDQVYNLKEIREIQMMFAISNIDIVERLSNDDFEPFEEENRDEKFSRVLKQLISQGIFEDEHVGDFKNLKELNIDGSQVDNEKVLEEIKNNITVSHRKESFPIR